MTEEPMAETVGETPHYQGSAIFSYGFRPFFLTASLFAGFAVPVWILILAGETDMTWQYPAREWHVHEMVFGFLPAVMTGFLLTAIPNWTDRPPVRGIPLMLLLTLWLAGRIAIATAWVNPLLSAFVDGAFLVVVTGILWREIAVGQAWDRLPIGFLISLYAFANILFHVSFLRGEAADFPGRMALALVMVLLALIGGRITPSFTQDFLADQGMTEQTATFSRMDGLSIILVVVASVAWIVYPRVSATGWMLVAAGLTNLVRLLRWHGWLTWREPLVLILHLGYGWLVISLLIIGGAILGLGLPEVDAVHALTTGAVGVMTLAVMTRASLGHTGRPKHAGIMTILIYLMVNLGAILRLLGPSTAFATLPVLSLAAVCWSGAYMLFVVVYGPMLLRPSLEEQ
ncbi:MAG: NnrS family protein [Nitrospirota bacterium]|nr:MAG: NnrS family protein [Nitrospirota bacterium]